MAQYELAINLCSYIRVRVQRTLCGLQLYCRVNKIEGAATARYGPILPEEGNHKSSTVRKEQVRPVGKGFWFYTKQA